MSSTRIISKCFGLVLSCGVLLCAAPAWADQGLAVHSNQISAAQRSKLRAQIDAYRAQHPAAFSAVANVKGHLPEHYRKTRLGKPNVVRELRRMGAPALLPMLEALAFDAPQRGAATEREWQALTVGMLMAVGELQDKRASTVLRLAFQNAAIAPIERAAAEALGRLCDAKGYNLLTKHAAGGAKQLAAWRGLGQCRQIEAAQQLAQYIETATTTDEVVTLGESLGAISSSWAWRALGPAVAADGLTIRQIAAEALVPAFIRTVGQARAAVKVGLTMAEYPSMAQLVDQHRHRMDAATAADMDRLVKRIEKRLARRAP